MRKYIEITCQSDSVSGFCPDNIFGTTQPFATKLGTVMSQSVMQKKKEKKKEEKNGLLILKVTVVVRTNIIIKKRVSDVSSELLTSLEANFVG